MRTVLVAGLAGLIFVSQGVAATPAQRFADALKTLTAPCKDMCGYGLGTSSAEASALDELWNATEDWTLAWLESSSGLAPGNLNAELKKRHPDNRTDVAPTAVSAIAPDLYAFTAQWNETGTVFLAAMRNGRWSVAWDIRKADPGKFAMLRAWRSDHANPAKCDDRLECGPLYGAVYPLAADAQGHPRFAVRAAYAQPMGATVTAQISFWRWDGKGATALSADRFAHMADDVMGDFKPDRIALRVKDDFKSFMSCGACVGRQLDWTFRILPDRIADDGKKPLYPELDAVDAILWRYLHGKPAQDLASPAAAAALGKMFAAAEGESDSLGMEGDRKITPTKTGADVCLATDGFFATHFILERRGNGYFVRDVRNTRSQSCTQPAGK